jgi:3-hydroxy-9,10-secoandrosta-1,3,5(10)-triene-9,17-dione monooxygenase
VGELRDRAAQLLPTLADRAAATEAQRRVPEETIKDLQDADLFRALQPKRFNGLESDPIDFFDAVIQIGTVCASTAWVLGVVAVHSWQLALFPLEAQLDVWGEDDQVLVSSSYAPTGTIEPVEGGYLLSGTWYFSSGTDNCRWAFLGGVVPREEGAPPPPDMRTFLVPDSDYEIVDDWYVAGLSGSGSKAITVDRAFVPEHRTHRFSDVLAMSSPGHAVNEGPLYRVPFGGIFCSSVSTPSLGAARGALERFVERSKTRVMVDRTRAIDDPFAQVRIAETSAALDGVYLQMRANFTEMLTHAHNGTQPSIERRARFRWDASRMTRVATECIDSIFEASGGGALKLDGPLQRAFRDVHAMRGHANNNAEKTAQMFGRIALGFPNKEFLI